MFRPSRRATEHSEAIVSSLCLADGRPARAADHLHVLQMPGRSAGANELYLVIETPHGVSAPPDLLAEVGRMVAEGCAGASRSVTRALRDGLLAANHFLFEHNLSVEAGGGEPKPSSVLLGLNCLFLRGNDAYMAQLGPSLTTHVQGDEITRYPTDSVWLRSANPGTFDLTRQPPAGLRSDVEPDLWHAMIEPGDALILSTTMLARFSSRGQLAQAVADHANALEALETLAAGRDLSAIVIETPGGPSRPDRISSTDRRPFPSEPDQSTTSEDALPPHEKAQPLEDEDSAYADEEAFADDVLGWTEEQEQDIDRHDATDVDAPPRTSVSGGASVDLGRIGKGIARGAQSLRKGTQDVLLSVLPEEAPPRPEPPPRGPRGLVTDASARSQSISLSGKALVIVAMIIPLVMLGLVIMTRVQYERLRMDQFDLLQAQAQAQYDSALKMPTDVDVRRELEEALRIVRDGLALQSDNKDLQGLERRIVRKMEEIDKVELLHHTWKLRDLDDAPVSPTDSSRIVVQGIDVFVLNRGSSRVYQFLLNDAGDAFVSADTNPILVQKGELRGGVTLGDIVDIAWLAAGGDRTLSTFVALERSGFLLAYDPQTGIDVLPVADSDTWLKPDAIGGYYGNLYVLDPLLGRLLKYVPEENAYTSPPSDYIAPNLNVNLIGAVDMAIDGNIYVLLAAGDVLKFDRGEPVAFPLQGLPSPMRSPTTIFVSGEQEPDAAGYVYVGDTGNERILQFDKFGNYLRQFRVPAGQEQLKGLRGLYVDEAKQRIFFLSGRTLWMASIPQLRH